MEDQSDKIELLKNDVKGIWKKSYFFRNHFEHKYDKIMIQRKYLPIDVSLIKRNFNVNDFMRRCDFWVLNSLPKSFTSHMKTLNYSDLELYKSAMIRSYLTLRERYNNYYDRKKISEDFYDIDYFGDDEDDNKRIVTHQELCRNANHLKYMRCYFKPYEIMELLDLGKFTNNYDKCGFEILLFAIINDDVEFLLFFDSYYNGKFIIGENKQTFYIDSFATLYHSEKVLKHLKDIEFKRKIRN